MNRINWNRNTFIARSNILSNPCNLARPSGILVWVMVIRVWSSLKKKHNQWIFVESAKFGCSPFLNHFCKGIFLRWCRLYSHPALNFTTFAGAGFGSWPPVKAAWTASSFNQHKKTLAVQCSFTDTSGTFQCLAQLIFICGLFIFWPGFTVAVISGEKPYSSYIQSFTMLDKPAWSRRTTLAFVTVVGHEFNYCAFQILP